MDKVACSVSQSSSTGYLSPDHIEDSARNFGSETSAATTAAHAQRRTAQLAALLSTEAGQALVRRHLGQAAEDPTAKAKRQTDQLAAMLSSEAGKAALQQQLNDYLQRKQQAQASVARSQSSVTGTSLLSQPSCTAPATGSRAEEALFMARAAEGSIHGAANLHPCTLSAAAAVSRTQPSSTDRAAVLTALKQQLLQQHASLQAGLASAGASRAATAQEQQLQQPGDIRKALAALLASRGAAAGDSMPAAAAAAVQRPSSNGGLQSSAVDAAKPLAQVWAMLQQKHQQQKHQQEIEATHDLMRVDTQMSDVHAEPNDAVSHDNGSLSRIPSQVVFKRRANNSTALRKHFSSGNRTVARSSESNASGINKPQQLFKKQRKKPLMLWSSSNNLPQQVQAARLQQQQQQQTSSQYNTVEPEYSCVSGSSGAATSGCDAAAALLEARAAAAAAPSAMAAPATAPSKVERVLSTLARQEQQLMILQQQLRQQRELITARRQAQQQRQQEAAAPAPLPASAVHQLLRMGMQAGALQPAAAVDVDMAEAWQPAAAAAPAVPDAVNQLVNLAKLVAAQQQQQQQQAGAISAAAKAPSAPMASQGPVWDADVLRKLTAALLTA